MTNPRLRKPLLILSLIALLPLYVVPATSQGQWIEKNEIPSPLLDSEPFELLFLNEEGENAILKIVPLENPIPNSPPDGKLLVFSFADSPEKFQVPYGSLESHKTFNDLVIDEANAWMKQKKYSLAFRNLLYAYDHGGANDPQLVQSLRNCLFQDGKQSFQAGRYELALSIFEDIYRQDPGFRVQGINRSLIEVIQACYDGILEADFKANDYGTVRQKIAAVTEKYPDMAGDFVKRWQQRFKQRADELLQEARRFADEGNGRQAHLSARRAEQVDPGRDDVKQLQEKFLNQFPLIVIGVSQSGSDADGQRMEHWGARRVGRLTQRTIVELSGLTDEGGKYSFLNGTFSQIDEQGLKYQLELAPDPPTFAAPPTTTFQISSRLLDAADPQSPSYNESWAKILKTVSIEGENKVIVHLRTPYVRPEALLDIPYFEPAESGSEQAEERNQNGVYVARQTSNDVTTFEFNPMYERVPGRQHPVLIEQLYPTASQAVDDLLKGNIDAVDRIPISDLERLKNDSQIVVRPYVLPTVHMLIPKIRGELANDPYFRSGLSHAINRESLLHDAICDGEEVDGCEVVSGPFPIGSQDNDQISYGYDLRVRPMVFNTKLAMVLIEIALRPTPKRPDRLEPPALVLAHPDSSIASEASAAIARGWSMAGVPTTTRKLKPNETQPPDDLWDFLYVEATLEEPLTDVSELVGKHGIATDISAPAQQTLRNVSYANSWRSAAAALRRLHRQLSVDQSVIPLWQTQEYYAYRNTVFGIGRDLIHLYQYVDRWRIDLTASEDEEE